jgi:hypothetical protein
MRKVMCNFCGKKFDPRGLGPHQRTCSKVQMTQEESPEKMKTSTIRNEGLTNTVSFCPDCGCNIKAVSEALDIARSLSDVK